MAQSSIYIEKRAFVKELASYVNAYGPVFNLPNAELPYDAHLKGHVVEHKEIVSDGFQHWIVLQENGSFGYIVQIGSVMGTRMVFGPFKNK